MKNCQDIVIYNYHFSCSSQLLILKINNAKALKEKDHQNVSISKIAMTAVYWPSFCPNRISVITKWYAIYLWYQSFTIDCYPLSSTCSCSNGKYIKVKVKAKLSNQFLFAQSQQRKYQINMWNNNNYFICNFWLWIDFRNSLPEYHYQFLSRYIHRFKSVYAR